MDEITKTYIQGGGLFAETYYEENFLIPSKIIYMNVTDIKEYQKQDIDFIVKYKHKLRKIEIKGDVASSKYGRYFIEFVTHFESVDKNIQQELLKYFEITEYFSINEFYKMFGDKLPESTIGCNFKSKSDYIIYIPLQKINDIYQVYDKLPILKTDTNKLKNFKFYKNIKGVYVPQKDEPGKVIHYNDDNTIDGINLGISVEPFFLLKNNLAIKLNYKNNKS